MPLVLRIAFIAFAYVTAFDRDVVHGQMVSTGDLRVERLPLCSFSRVDGLAPPAPVSLAGSDASSSESMPPNETRWS